MFPRNDKWLYLYGKQRPVRDSSGTHSSTLAWKDPWMEESGRLQSLGLLTVGHDWAIHFHFSLSCIGEGNGHPLQCSCLENSGTGEPGGLPSMGLHRVGHDWSDLAAAAAAYPLFICFGFAGSSLLPRLSPDAESRGYSLVVVCELLTVMLLLLQSTGSRFVGFSSCGAWLSCPVACGMLIPRRVIKITSPALAGRFFTTEPSGKPLLPFRTSIFVVNKSFCPR